jgi:predicted RecB family nuclease
MAAPKRLRRKPERQWKRDTTSFQATFLYGNLYGRADFLRRVEQPSRLGAFSYEVLDTKLARSPKAKFVAQLAFYSDLLADAQGVAPQMMHLILGDRTGTEFPRRNRATSVGRATAFSRSSRGSEPDISGAL